MSTSPIDAVDRAVHYQLQVDARRTTTELADYANVSDNTVRNRLERAEVIQGDSVDVGSHHTGAQRYCQFICTARQRPR